MMASPAFSIAGPSLKKAAFFLALRDPDLFSNAEIHRELGVITWNNEIDIAPETAYSLATGSPLPEWMEKHEVSAPDARTKVKVPDVCAAFHVVHCDTFDMLRQRGVLFA